MSLDDKNPWKTFSYPEGEREWFFAGGWEKWAKEYGELFSAIDAEKVNNCITRKHYFHEWKAAIKLYTEHNYRSVLAPYNPRSEDSSPHRRKAEEVRGRVPDKVWAVIETEVEVDGKIVKPRVGLPDLFVYSDDKKDEWFYFAEVKGPGDKIGPKQKIKSERLDEAAGKRVSGIIKLEMATEPFTSPR